MQLSLLKRNITANFLGRGMTAMMLLIVVPLYIDFLGIEAYGIIGFFASLVALGAVFDPTRNPLSGLVEINEATINHRTKEDPVASQVSYPLIVCGAVMPRLLGSDGPFRNPETAHLILRRFGISPAKFITVYNMFIPAEQEFLKFQNSKLSATQTQGNLYSVVPNTCLQPWALPRT